MKYFGTDGIRGVVGGDVLTLELAYRIGFSIGELLLDHDMKKVLIGRDTRLSGQVLSGFVACGIAATGVHVIDIGVAPTPAVAYLTKKKGADIGVMITASHNPPEYNGIKLFSNQGNKIDDNLQNELEDKIDKLKMSEKPQLALKMGKIAEDHDAIEQYIDHMVKIVDCDLAGLNVRLDLCHGASFHTAAEAFKKMGANAVLDNEEPDGEVVNQKCGATDTKEFCNNVKLGKNDVGFSYDGDADRLIAVDENGQEIDGDKILFLIAKWLKDHNKLKDNVVVGTIITTLALELALKSIGVELVRVDVGDQYIIREMIEKGYSLGGERSGHIIISHYSNTGDGVLASMVIAKIMKETGMKLSELVASVPELPTIQKGYKMSSEAKLALKNDEGLKRIVDKCKVVAPNARVVVRASGTENKYRVDVQGEDDKIVNIIAETFDEYINIFIAKF